MTTRLIARRVTAILASAGVTAALTLIPAAGAQAGVAANFMAVGQASARFVGSGGGSCDLSSAPGSDNVESSPVAFGHGTKNRSVDLSATFTNSLDSGDQVKVKGHVKSTLTLKRHGGGLRSLEVKSDGAVTISHTTIGSQCQASGLMYGEIPSATFTESKKGSLDLTFKTNHPNVVVQIVIVNAKTGQIALEMIDVTNSLHGGGSAILKPGKYAILSTAVGIFGGNFSAKSASLTHKSSADVVVRGVFTPKKH